MEDADVHKAFFIGVWNRLRPKKGMESGCQNGAWERGVESGMESRQAKRVVEQGPLPAAPKHHMEAG